MKHFRLLLAISFSLISFSSQAQNWLGNSKSTVKNGIYMLIGQWVNSNYTQSGKEYLQFDYPRSRWSSYPPQVNGLVTATYFINDKDKCDQFVLEYRERKYLEPIVNEFKYNMSFKRETEKFAFIKDNGSYEVEVLLSNNSDAFAIVYTALKDMYSY